MSRTADRDRMQGAQSIDRALSLLTAFTAQQPQRRIADLVTESGLGQSTVSRMVSAMTHLGYLSHDARSGLYSLGTQVVTLAAVALNENPVHQQARQAAQDLAADLGLGVNVAQRLDDRLFYLCNFEGKQQPRSSTLIGRGGPIHATGLGKALVHEMSDADLERLIGTTFDSYTATTITTLADLRRELDLVSERGYAIEHEELALRRSCLAAPIRDRSGEVVAAISVSGPLSAIDLPAREDELGTRLIEEADRISVNLGYTTSLA